jgi:peptidyl-prolyl cis-trans isomerase A (cyclophilin A)
MTKRDRTLLLWILIITLTSVGLAQEAPKTTAPAPATQQDAREPGLYWTIETSLGNIHCELFEEQVPITVKMMAGLARGTIGYIDPKTKQKVTGKKLFDGLTFHRVMPKFMIQGGDPLGTGEGGPEGPGFPFRDEFSPTLRFDIPGRLAMANAGPNTNGSQFFITEVPLPYLNDKHTIFGQCSDLEIVRTIARVPTTNDAPVKPVIIKRIVVERVGNQPAKAPAEAGAAKRDKPPVP